MKETHDKDLWMAKTLRTHGKENIDGKAVSRRTAKLPNTAKYKRHRRARLCLVFF
jgi:hypothetical protein